VTRLERELIDAALRWARLKKASDQLGSFAAHDRANVAEDVLEKACEKLLDERRRMPS